MEHTLQVNQSKSTAQLDSRVYAVTILIHDYTPSGHKEPESEYSDSVLYDKTQKYMEYAQEEKIRQPIFRKYIHQIKEYSLVKSNIHYFILCYKYPWSILWTYDIQKL